MKLQKGEVVVVQQDIEYHDGASEVVGVWVVETDFEGPEQHVQDLEHRGVLRRVSAHHVYRRYADLPGKWETI